ncbi:MAG: hypothetical protein V8T45_10195 [Oscillospiraceae bacterium]
MNTRVPGFGGDVTISSDVDVVGAFLNWDSFKSFAEREGAALAPVCFIRFSDSAKCPKDMWHS